VPPLGIAQSPKNIGEGPTNVAPLGKGEKKFGHTHELFNRKNKWFP